MITKRYSTSRKKQGRVLSIMLLLLIAIASGLSGCATAIPATIAVRHTLPDSTTLTRYAFAPLEAQETGTEVTGYTNLIRRELIKYRYLESDAANASLLVTYSYGINEGRERPEQGMFRAGSYTEYRKGFWFFIYENTPGLSSDERKLVYEGSVVCAGSLMQISTVMPAMIRALFTEFPGESGIIKKTFLEP